MMTKRIWQMLVWLGSVLLLSACGPFQQQPWVRLEQAGVVDQVTLDADHSVGQTFVARYDGLSAVSFFLTPAQAGEGAITLHLRADATALDDIAQSTSLEINDLSDASWQTFTFPPQERSNRVYYYAFLELSGDGRVLVGQNDGDSYLNGALYQNHLSQDTQAAFQLGYTPQMALHGLWVELGGWLGILLVGIGLYILPGWGVLSALWPGWGSLRWPEKLGLAAGFSLAIYPILILWTDLVGLHLGAAYSWIPLFVGGYLWLWHNRPWEGIPRHWRAICDSVKKGALVGWRSPFLLADAALGGILVFVVFSRFWVIRSLDAPLWGDSYQHTMIAQLLVDHDGLFTSWEPYAELTTFTYHFGFHSAVAAFHWLSGMEILQAVLWVGQWVNVLAVVSLYPLATRIGRGPWAGVVAVLVAGLLSPMPMFYTNWGRYTQLSGQAILPAVIWMAWQSLEDARPLVENRRLTPLVTMIALTGSAMGGLALAHYRVLIFALPFFAAFLLFEPRRWSTLLRIAWIGVAGGGIFLPWFVRVFGGRVLAIFRSQISTPATGLSAATLEYNTIGNLDLYLPIAVWILLFLSIGCGLWRQNRGSAILGLWWFLVMIAANPNWVLLPGTGALSNFAVLIAAYLPASVAIGDLGGQWVEKAAAWVKNSAPGRMLFAIGLFAGVLGMAFGGFRFRLRELQPAVYALLTRPDLRAAQWIREHTPADSYIAVNSFRAYGGSAVVGSDGGWWLSLLTERENSVPPLTYGFEQGSTADYHLQVHDINDALQEEGGPDLEILGGLASQGPIYIYIGQRQGKVNHPESARLDPEQLSSSRSFDLLYHQDRVWLFKFNDRP